MKISQSCLCAFALLSSSAVFAEPANEKPLEPTASIAVGGATDGDLVAGSIGVSWDRLGVDLELRRTAGDFDYEDHRVGLALRYDLVSSDRFRVYGLARAFVLRRRVLVANNTLEEQDGAGAEVGLGLAARLTDFAEVFGEFAVGRKSWDDSAGATAMIGLRFR